MENKRFRLLCEVLRLRRKAQDVGGSPGGGGVIQNPNQSVNPYNQSQKPAGGPRKKKKKKKYEN